MVADPKPQEQLLEAVGVTPEAPYRVKWEARVVGVTDWRSSLHDVIGMGVLSGFIAGVGITVYQLEDFTFLPGWMGFVLVLVAGIFLGMLTYDLNHSLVAFLIASGVTALIGTAALVLPELGLNRLDLEVAAQLGFSQAMLNTILAIPLLLIGLLIGKFIPHEED